MSRTFFIILFLLSAISLNAQNLVFNGSFDNTRGTRPTMKPWNKINTVDFFVNAEGKRYKEVNAAKTDRNYILRKPRSGHAYVGIRVWPKYNEYLQVTLRRPLSENKAYSFEMYITPSRYSNCYLKTIGTSFYPNRPPYMSSFGKESFPPQVEVYKASGIRDTTEWIRINGVFIAKGGEKVLTIGNFSTSTSEKFKRKKFSLKKREAYYYIDDVSVYELDEQGLPIMDSIAHIQLQKESIESDTTVVDFEDNTFFDGLDSALTNIYFAENSSKIDDQSYRKLGVITEYLFENPNVNIRIESFAVDGEMNGQELKIAEKRLRSVSNFFYGNKISKSRIKQSAKILPCTSRYPRLCRKAEIIILQ